MKKHLLTISVLTLSVVLFNGCKDDEDTTPPVITILGDNPDELEMRTTYVDAGATATDDEDGDLTSAIVVNNEINNLLPGDYEIHYTVTDAAGNTSDSHREVTVFATNSAIATNYSVVDICTTGSAVDTFTYNQTITASGTNGIAFSLFGNYSGNTGITGSVASNGTITLPQQTGLNIGGLSEDHTFTGITGKVEANGIYLEYNDRNDSAVPVSTATCKARFTRL